MIRLLAKAKYRFDLGAGFLSVINTGIISITASDKIAASLGVSMMTALVITFASVVGAVWTCGHVLDKLNFAQAYTDECNERNEMLKEIRLK